VRDGGRVEERVQLFYRSGHVQTDGPVPVLAGDTFYDSLHVEGCLVLSAKYFVIAVWRLEAKFPILPENSVAF